MCLHLQPSVSQQFPRRLPSIGVLFKAQVASYNLMIQTSLQLCLLLHLPQPRYSPKLRFVRLDAFHLLVTADLCILIMVSHFEVLTQVINLFIAWSQKSHHSRKLEGLAITPWQRRRLPELNTFSGLTKLEFTCFVSRSLVLTDLKQTHSQLYQVVFVMLMDWSLVPVLV